MTDTMLTAGGVQHASDTIATADQETIFGDGTFDKPFRAGAGSSGLRARFVGIEDPIAVGRPVYVIVNDEPDEVLIQLATAGLPTPEPSSIGLVSEVFGDPDELDVQVTVQAAGTLTLTTVQWDAVTGDSGGLVPATVYYLSFGFNDLGHLTRVVTTDPGRFVVQMGVALNATTMLISTMPAVPKEVP